MRLGLFVRSVAVFMVTMAFAVTGAGQSQKQDSQPANSSISGQVKAGGVPLANKTVTATRVDNQRELLATNLDSVAALDLFQSAKTDADGRYRISGLRAGTYQVGTSAAAFAEDTKTTRHYSITLDDNEAKENIDFSFVRGGVITGRVMDADGRPLIAQLMQLRLVKENGEERIVEGARANGEKDTDDRGVYRLFGLAPGRYLVGVGGNSRTTFGPASKYPLTYFPGTTDVKQARVVEVAEGMEISEIDFRLGGPTKTYEAIGRVLDADSGQPVPQVTLVCVGRTDPRGIFGYSSSTTSDAKGEFRFAGLPSGQYTVQLTSNSNGLLGNQSEHYAEETTFEVMGANVSGVQVQAKRGAILNGVVVIEGTPEQKRQLNLGQMMIMAYVQQKKGDRQGANQQEDTISTDYSATKLNSDGTYRMAGLPPGNVAGFNVIGLTSPTRPRPIRIERDGVVMPEGFEVHPGETISGIKVVMAVANGSIRGQVIFTGGNLPKDWRAGAFATRIKNQTQEYDRDLESAEVDNKGRFIIEGLIDGEYEISIFAGPENGESRNQSVEQRVRVNGGEATVTITFDLSKKREDR